MKKETALYFGSFNPPHIGHTAIANYILNNSDVDELWFMVSPQNPLKKSSSLLPARTRLELCRLALEDHPKMRASDFEFNLPRPSYTVHTLIQLEEKFPDRLFSIIMGMDNLQNFHKWKSYETILENYRILVYPRPGFNAGDYEKHPTVQIIDAPLMQISSSYIRKEIKDGNDVRFFMRSQVYQMIDREGLYF
ncbi:MAG: nicotinic acid mononucleotide adenylyltransferase [Marinilabiliales bacterium]|nr:MAG: nicotinic acid mononucleotide adenylyltransferase [Marinilabiliales bacterium]